MMCYEMKKMRKNKCSSIRFRLSEEEKILFQKACEESKTTPSKILREFSKKFSEIPQEKRNGMVERVQKNGE